MPPGRLRAPGLVTSQRGLSPEPVSHLHVVVPAQPASVEVQGGEVQDDLKPGRGGEKRGVSPPWHPVGSLCWVVPRPMVMSGSIRNPGDAGVRGTPKKGY